MSECMMLSSRTWLYVPTKAPAMAAGQEMSFGPRNQFMNGEEGPGVQWFKNNWQIGRPTTADTRPIRVAPRYV